MKAFRIHVDGHMLGDFGVADFSNMTMFLNLFSQDRGPHYYTDNLAELSVGGITVEDADGVCWGFRWKCPAIDLGSKVEVEIVESETCVSPVKRYATETSAPEAAFSDEEMRELRYKDYLELKKEFGHLPDPRA
jgi:hypothetical protein